MSSIVSPKPCKKCGGTRFGTATQKVCLDCAKERNSKYYRENIEKRREYDRKRNETPERKADKAASQARIRKEYPGKRRSRERERYKKNFPSFENARLKYNYGITLDDYVDMLSGQNGVCAICFQFCASGNRLAVDHCHKTGKVRGLLCRRCNQAIGKFEDSAEMLRRASDYLEGK